MAAESPRTLRLGGRVAGTPEGCIWRLRNPDATGRVDAVLLAIHTQHDRELIESCAIIFNTSSKYRSSNGRNERFVRARR
jgi:hypothetical protein